MGDEELRVLHTPGHTPDSISLLAKDRVFTGDVLFIHGTGRADFAGGDPGIQYDSIARKLFTLPDQTWFFPRTTIEGILNRRSEKRSTRIRGWPASRATITST